MTSIPPLVAAVVSAFPAWVANIPATHAEFVAWARTQQDVDTRIVDFLADRDDCAGSTPADWMRMARMGVTPWFRMLPGHQRTMIAVSILGQDASNALMDWAVQRSMPRPTRAVRRGRRALAA